MSRLEPTVYIVDDDVEVRDSISLLLDTHGIPVRAYSRAESFLQDYAFHAPGCLLLDIGLPGMDGLDLQSEFKAVGDLLPIIFITGRADVPMAVQALRSGAFDFLEKPCAAETLLRVLREALAFSVRQSAEIEQRKTVEKRLEKLSPRESEVLDYIVGGHANKVIAADLELSQRTVEIYRANVMQKMQVDSLAQLVQQMTRLSRPVDSTETQGGG